MSSSDYESHATRLQKRAEAQHREWVASLTPEVRKNLEKLGVLEPPDDSHEVGGHSPFQPSDVAESPLARIDVDFASTADGVEGEISDLFKVSLPKAKAILAWHTAEMEASRQANEADLLSVVVGGLLASDNIRISAAGLAFASNMDAANGLGNQARYARSLGVSRSILSKSVKAWRRQLNLRPSPWQKSDEACATYSQVAKNSHWRKAKTSAVKLMEKLNQIRQAKQS
jgi:hypothetical protein